jgi:hypothetical protein
MCEGRASVDARPAVRFGEVVSSAPDGAYFFAFLRLRRFFGAADFILRFFALFAIVRLFQIDTRRECSASWWPRVSDLLLRADDEESIGINGEGLDDSEARVAYEPLGLIPSGPGIARMGPPSLSLDIRFSESGSRHAQHRAREHILPREIVIFA